MQSTQQQEGRKTRVGASRIHGKGLFAAETIQKDDYIGTITGRKASRDGSHVLWITELDGTVWGLSARNKLRYVNHSSRPNCMFDGTDLYALRRIRAGEELTFNYEGD